MHDCEKTREQLLVELDALRRRVDELETLPSSGRGPGSRWVPGGISWESLLANTPLFVLVLDEECCIRYLNHTDSGVAAEQLIGKPLDTFCRPADRQRVRECVQRVFQTGEPVVCEGPAFRLDEQEHWYLAHFGPVLADGKVAAASVISINATDSRRSDVALRESEERFRKVFEEGPLAISVRSADGRLICANQRFGEMLGYEDHKLAGLGVADLTHPDDWERERQLRGQLHSGEIPYYTIEKRCLRGDGQVIWVQVTVSMMHDAEGRRTNTIAMIQDITERKRAQLALENARRDLERRVEERTAELTGTNERLRCEVEERQRTEHALRESESRYRTLVETSPDAVLMLDTRWKITFASRKAVEMYGGDRVEELLGKDAREFFLPEDHPRLLANLSRTVKEGVTKVIEYTIVRKDGSHMAASTTAALVRGESGEAEGLVAIVRDVGERKRAEKALECERQTLKHLLQSSDHERQLIAYEIHDGLAQQIAGALMQFETCAGRKDAQPTSAAQAFDAAMTILRQGHAEVRRLISGVRSPVLDEAGVVAAIAQLVSEEERAGGPQIEFLSDVKFHRLTPILENAIYRIVQEGLTNACRHSRSRRVGVELAQRGERVRIVVQDQGIGFNPEEIGERHFGVAGIRDRARLLGGSCRIDSAPGQGTRITVELPVVPWQDDESRRKPQTE